jgi:hypothetical protein
VIYELSVILSLQIYTCSTFVCIICGGKRVREKERERENMFVCVCVCCYLFDSACMHAFVWKVQIGCVYYSTVAICPVGFVMKHLAL